MRTIPPLIKANNYTTSATPYTATVVGNSIAAPGVGKRLRIVSFHVAKRLQNPLVTGECGVAFTDSLSAQQYWYAYLVSVSTSVGGVGQANMSNEPGWQLSDNAALQITHVASVASFQFTWDISYYIDVVT